MFLKGTRSRTRNAIDITKEYNNLTQVSPNLEFRKFNSKIIGLLLTVVHSMYIECCTVVRRNTKHQGALQEASRKARSGVPRVLRGCLLCSVII